MRGRWRYGLPSKKIDLPPGVLEPREAVLKMAPYSPPTGGRADKLRLDFNENTVGVSPKVLEYLREHLTEAGVAMYPEYGEIKQELAAIAMQYEPAPIRSNMRPTWTTTPSSRW